MKVKNIYQDRAGNWHIDYDLVDLMGLAIRVYFGQLFLGICVGLFLLPLVALASGTSQPKQPNIAPNSDYIVSPKSICKQLPN